MPCVSLIVEALRARPVAVFWSAALLQAFLWVLIPAVFYAAPPGDLPVALAVGREYAVGSTQGPPLAFWLADLAFRAGGGRAIGVYVLAQLCVVAAFWLVFALGRRLAGAHHAALAVLLMGGILALSIPTPEFGPAVLALPLVALVLFLFWLALGEDRRNAWIGFGFVLGALLLTSHVGLLVAAALLAVLVISATGRSALRTVDPWMAFAVAGLIPFPYAIWMWRSGYLAEQLSGSGVGMTSSLVYWPLLLVAVIAAHAGLLALVVLASGWPASSPARAPEISGPAIPAFGRLLVLSVAIALPLAGTLAAAFALVEARPVWAAPLVLLSGLAVVLACGNRVALHRQEMLGTAWIGAVLLPPIFTIAAFGLLPWTGTADLSARQPAGAIAQFFTDTFRRRTGRPLEVVAGEGRWPYLVGAASADHPRVLQVTNLVRAPVLSESDVRAKGMLVVWTAEEGKAEPPASIRARFPNLTPEVPQVFEWPVQGLLPPLRLGWALVRPSR
jgi:hypothetical protein